MIIYLQTLDTPREKDRFEVLYRTYRGMMFHTAMAMLGNRQDAEDAVHQSFLAILGHFSKIGEIDSPKTRSFCVIIVRRKSIDILQARKRDDWLPLDEGTAGAGGPAPGGGTLAEAMAALPEKYRQVLLLRYDNGLSTREIAGLFGITDSGVRKTIARAKEMLRSAMEAEV